MAPPIRYRENWKSISERDGEHKHSPVEHLATCTVDIPEACHEWLTGGRNALSRHGRVLKDAWATLKDVCATTGDRANSQAPNSIGEANLRKLQQLMGTNPTSFMADLQDVVALLAKRDRELGAQHFDDARAGLVDAMGRVETWKDFELRHDGLWGCKAQFAFGKCLVRMLKDEGLTRRRVHPFWGVLIFPQGGTTGVGHGDLRLVEWSTRRAIVVHTCVQDAYGYIFKYHGKGPGYSYFGRLGPCAPSTSPLEGQLTAVVATFFIFATRCRSSRSTGLGMNTVAKRRSDAHSIGGTGVATTAEPRMPSDVQRTRQFGSMVR